THSDHATVQKTAAHATPSGGSKAGFRAAPIARSPANSRANSGEQLSAIQLFAGMLGSGEKPLPLSRRLTDRSRRRREPKSIAGRDNFRDNLGDNPVRVSRDVVYT